ncbi:MAG: carbohydrate-binding family 9-like protein, partial [Victivallales bacterium]|nr:carbohydrate-binding family 9-like protein [Victivallales bacterium]
IPLNPPEGQGAFLGNFVALDGEQLPEAATRVWVSRTAEALKFHIECQEPLMPQTYANVTAHDGQLWNDDCVEVFLQPAGWKEYAHFIVNSLGTKYEEMGRGGRDWDPTWNAKAERKVYDWSVDIELPFESLGATPAEGEIWKFNVCRSRKAVSELSSWSPSPSGTFHDQAAFGSAVFEETSYPIGNQEDNDNFLWRVVSGAEPSPVESASIPLKNGNLAVHIDYQESGKVVYSALRLVRTSQVANILSPVKEFLDTAEEAVLLRQEREALLSLSENASPAACAILERNARGLLKRAEYLRNCNVFTSSGHAVGELVYGVESSLVKILPGEHFGGVVGGELRLDAARREMDAGQVVLFAGDSPLLQAEAWLAGPLKSAEGVELPSECLRIRRVALVKTCVPDYPAPMKGNLPDPLVPATPFDVAANGFETLWVDVRVPVETRPGVYRGSLVLKARNTEATAVPVEVRVRNFTIPQLSSIVSAFGTRFNAGRFNYDREKYLENYLEHRITPYFYARNPKLLRKPAMDWSAAEALEVRWQSDSAAGVLLKITMLDGKLHSLATPVEAANEPHESRLSLPPEAQGAVWAVTAMLPGSVSGRLSVELLRNGERVALIPETELFAKVSGEWIDQWPGVVVEA